MISKEKFFEVMDGEGVPRLISDILWRNHNRATSWLPPEVLTEEKEVAAIKSTVEMTGARDWDIHDLPAIEKSLEEEASRMEKIGQLYKLMNLTPTYSNFQSMLGVIN